MCPHREGSLTRVTEPGIVDYPESVVPNDEGVSVFRGLVIATGLCIPLYGLLIACGWILLN